MQLRCVFLLLYKLLLEPEHSALVEVNFVKMFCDGRNCFEWWYLRPINSFCPCVHRMTSCCSAKPFESKFVSNWIKLTIYAEMFWISGIDLLFENDMLFFLYVAQIYHMILITVPRIIRRNNSGRREGAGERSWTVDCGQLLEFFFGVIIFCKLHKFKI